MPGVGGDVMNLPAYYTCPAGHAVAVIRDSLNDAPDEWHVDGRSVFRWCNECEVVGEGESCLLRLEMRT